MDSETNKNSQSFREEQTIFDLETGITPMKPTDNSQSFREEKKIFDLETGSTPMKPTHNSQSFREEKEIFDLESGKETEMEPTTKGKQKCNKLNECGILGIVFGCVIVIGVIIIAVIFGAGLHKGKETTSATKWRFPHGKYGDCCGTDGKKQEYLKACNDHFNPHSVECINVTDGSIIVHLKATKKQKVDDLKNTIKTALKDVTQIGGHSVVDHHDHTDGKVPTPTIPVVSNKPIKHTLEFPNVTDEQKLKNIVDKVKKIKDTQLQKENIEFDTLNCKVEDKNKGQISCTFETPDQNANDGPTKKIKDLLKDFGEDNDFVSLYKELYEETQTVISIDYNDIKGTDLKQKENDIRDALKKKYKIDYGQLPENELMLLKFDETNDMTVKMIYHEKLSSLKLKDLIPDFDKWLLSTQITVKFLNMNNVKLQVYADEIKQIVSNYPEITSNVSLELKDDKSDCLAEFKFEVKIKNLNTIQKEQNVDELLLNAGEVELYKKLYKQELLIKFNEFDTSEWPEYDDWIDSVERNLNIRDDMKLVLVKEDSSNNTLTFEVSDSKLPPRFATDKDYETIVKTIEYEVASRFPEEARQIFRTRNVSYSIEFDDDITEPELKKVQEMFKTYLKETGEYWQEDLNSLKCKLFDENFGACNITTANYTPKNYQAFYRSELDSIVIEGFLAQSLQSHERDIRNYFAEHFQEKYGLSDMQKKYFIDIEFKSQGLKVNIIYPDDNITRIQNNFVYDEPWKSMIGSWEDMVYYTLSIPKVNMPRFLNLTTAHKSGLLTAANKFLTENFKDFSVQQVTMQEDLKFVVGCANKTLTDDQRQEIKKIELVLTKNLVLDLTKDYSFTIKKKLTN